MLEMLAMQREMERQKQEVTKCEKGADVVLEDKIQAAVIAFKKIHGFCMKINYPLGIIGLNPDAWCVSHENTLNATIRAAKLNHAIETLACNKPK